MGCSLGVEVWAAVVGEWAMRSAAQRCEIMRWFAVGVSLVVEVVCTRVKLDVCCCGG